MNNCAQCGAYVFSGASDCAKCGAVLAPVEDPSRPSQGALLNGFLILGTVSAALELILTLSVLAALGAELGFGGMLLMLFVTAVPAGRLWALWGMWKWKRKAVYWFFGLTAISALMSAAFGTWLQLIVAGVIVMLWFFLIRRVWADFK